MEGSLPARRNKARCARRRKEKGERRKETGRIRHRPHAACRWAGKGDAMRRPWGRHRP